MKRLSQLKYIFFLLVFASSTYIQAQKISIDQIKAEKEVFITESFHTEKAKTLHKLYLEQIQKDVDDHSDGHKTTSAEMERVAKSQVQHYFNALFFKQNPDYIELVDNYNATRSTATPTAASNPFPPGHPVCFNGGFEDTNFANFNFRNSTYNLPGGEACQDNCCGSFAVPVVDYPGSAADGYEIVDSSFPDPFTPIQRVHSGNKALRVNQAISGYGVNQISKTFVASPASFNSLNFWYALVFQDPAHTGALNKQPFIRIQARNLSTGVFFHDECIFADAASPDFDESIVGSGEFSSTIVYRDWTCYNLDVSSAANDPVQLIITVADCGQSAHWGYAYFDDFCLGCPEVDFTLEEMDSCEYLPFTVCGEMVGSGNFNGFVPGTLQMEIYENGAPITAAPPTLIGMAGDEFCFQVDASNFPLGFPMGGYDFFISTDVYFTDGDGNLATTTIFSDPIVDGENNDVNVNCRSIALGLDDNGPLQSVQQVIQFICANDSGEIWLLEPTSTPIDESEYTIVWNTGETGNHIMAYADSTYTVTAINNITGEVYSEVIDIDCCDLESVEIIKSCSTTADGCDCILYTVDQDGNALTSANGYFFNWSTGESTETVTVNGYGNYSVTVNETALCFQEDSIKLECCTGLQLSISYYCDTKCTKCTAKIYDQNGNQITLANGFNITWSNGFTTESVSVVPGLTLGATVQKGDCTWNVGPEYIQCQSCNIEAPAALRCTATNDRDKIQYTLSWSSVTGAAGYILEITYNDPTCCSTTDPEYGVSIPLSTTNYSFYAQTTDCFSWRVRGRCPDGTFGPFTAKSCNCRVMAKSSPVADENENLSPLNVFPVPTSDILEIEGAGLMVGNSLNIVDGAGRLIKTIPIEDNRKTSLDVSFLETGNYYLTLTDSNGTVKEVVKFIITE